MTATGHRMRSAILGALVALVVLTPLAQGAPSPEAVRQCVELNLPKYTNPGTAVVAQYADVETACRAALDDGDVSVEFDPGTGGTGSGTGSTPPETAGGSADPGTRTATTARTPSAPSPRNDTPTRTGPATDGGQKAPAPAATPADDAVDRAIAEADAGSPLPSTLFGGSLVTDIILGAALLMVLGAAGLAARRRLR